VAPGLFTVNANLVANAAVVCATAGGQQTTLLTYQVVNGALTANPIDLSGCSESVMVLYGTGFRGANGNVSVTFNGAQGTVLGAVAQSSFVGLDQANAVLPSGLHGDIVVLLTSAGLTSNPAHSQKH
jgi:uncharacterized protein (TIGR03437 family)